MTHGHFQPPLHTRHWEKARDGLRRSLVGLPLGAVAKMDLEGGGGGEGGGAADATASAAAAPKFDFARVVGMATFAQRAAEAVRVAAAAEEKRRRRRPPRAARGTQLMRYGASGAKRSLVAISHVEGQGRAKELAKRAVRLEGNALIDPIPPKVESDPVGQDLSELPGTLRRIVEDFDAEKGESLNRITAWTCAALTRLDRHRAVAARRLPDLLRSRVRVPCVCTGSRTC